jgi:hypothetical protein
MMYITNTQELRTAIRQGKFTSVGGYPLYFITSDGEGMSRGAVLQNYREVSHAVRNRDRAWAHWGVVALDVNWEDPNLFCCHTGERIESAYAEDDV